MVAWAMNSRMKDDPRSTTAPSPEGTQSPRESWREWGEVLRRHQLRQIAAWLLEAGRPLAVLSAQLLYAGSPFLGPGAHRLAHLLESEQEARAFVDYLESGTADSRREEPAVR